MDWSVAGGPGGAADGSGVPGLLSVVVRSIVGLLVEVLLVFIVVWMLSMVVLGLSFVSVAVVASVEMSGSGSWLCGGQWVVLFRGVAVRDCVGCAVWWYVLGCLQAGTVFSDGVALECRWCWEVDRAVLVKGLP